MKVLVIEDSVRLRRSLGRGLVHDGYTVDLAADGREGLAFAETNDYDVIVLDLMLPKLDGLTILRRLRDNADITPILILSAKDQVTDRVLGLESGADDYLVKPFSYDELCARIKALTRHHYNAKTPKICIGSITVDIAKRQVSSSIVEAIPLTPAEYSLLEHLVLSRGKVLSKQQLSGWLHNSESDTGTNVIEVLISTLRKKIRDAGEEDIVKTRRGYGYIIE